jgi:hypothetical protein
MNLLRTWVLLLAALAAWPLAAQEAATVAALPGAASPGSTITVRGDHLVNGRTYRVRLIRLFSNTLLGSAVAANEQISLSVPLPQLAAGGYTLQLEHTNIQTVVDATRAFTVLAPIGIAPSTTTPKAGKRLTVALSNLQQGTLRLRYAGRVVAGPVPTSGSSMSLAFTVPTDIPASLPASVTLGAEVIYGRGISQAGSVNVNTQPPFVGPRIGVRNLSTSTLAPVPRQPFTVQGTLDAFDGVPPSSVQLSAFWQSGNQLIPLPANAVQLQANGNFSLQTTAPGLGAMTAAPTFSSGQLKIVAATAADDGAAGWGFTRVPEFTVQTGPTLNPAFDTDAQVDLTFQIRKRINGAGDTAPLEGAYVLLGPSAPLQEPAAPGGPLASMGLSMHGFGGAISQVSSGFQLAAPAPRCGEDLFRRYSDALGVASFDFVAEIDQGGIGLQNNFATIAAVECRFVPDGQGGAKRVCTAVDDARYDFTATIYTLHTGAGERNADGSERPTRFAVTYYKDQGRFVLRNLATGVVTEQVGSANVGVTVPLVSGGPVTTLTGLRMSQGTEAQSPNQFRPVPTYQNGYSLEFGPFVDFSNSPNAYFDQERLRRRLAFDHHPGPVGPLREARLEFADGGTMATFARSGGGAGSCDANLDGQHEWEGFISPTVEQAQLFRRPSPILFPAGAQNRRYCAKLVTVDQLFNETRRNWCFRWQAPPAAIERLSFVDVDDLDADNVKLKGTKVENEGAAQAPAPGPFLGEPVNEVGSRRNHRRQDSKIDLTVGATGEKSSQRRFETNMEQQFNRPTPLKNQAVDFNNGASVNIGRDEWVTLFDQTFPLFRWVWGIPELAGAELFADLRLLSQYYFYGTLTKNGSSERVDLKQNVFFLVMLVAGLDIDVLFGLLFDAGATINAAGIAEMATVIRNNQLDPVKSGPCFTFRMDFYGWVDPCPLCPTPKIRTSGNILNARRPQGCGFANVGTDTAVAPEWTMLKAGEDNESGLPNLFDRADAVNLFRHPAAAFDNLGNGSVLLLDDQRRLLAMPLDDDGLGEPVVLSTAPGIRHVQVTYPASDRPLAVWTENALGMQAFADASLATIARNQRVAWSRFDGTAWTPKAFLTAPGNGQAHVALARCRGAFAPPSPCALRNGAVAVWQHNESADIRAPRWRLRARNFASTGWGSEYEIDPGASNVQDISPAIDFIGGQLAVTWVRYTGTSMAAVDSRRLAYRFGNGAAALVPGSPTRVAAPTVLGGAPGSTLKIAFTRADDEYAFAGTRQALQLGEASCASGSCSFTLRAARDAGDRPLYGEKPLLQAGAWGDPHVLMRGFHFGNVENLVMRPGDPIGTAMISGDLLSISPRFGDGSVRFRAVTNDGAMHFNHAAAFNPAREELVALSVPFVPVAARNSVKAAARALGADGIVPAGRLVASSGMVEVRSVLTGPDFVPDSVNAGSSPLQAGQARSVQVVVGNRGGGYQAARDGAARVLLHWDGVDNAPVGQLTLPDIPGGERRTVSMTLFVPPGFQPDEPHRLLAVVVADSEVMESDGSNNLASREWAGLPQPHSLRSMVRADSSFVQLNWSVDGDPRVVGYRIWAEDEPGQPFPLGSSTVPGFLDLSAQFDSPRRYFVTSYSARGVESARSDPVRVTSQRASLLFRAGFEP